MVIHNFFLNLPWIFFLTNGWEMCQIIICCTRLLAGIPLRGLSLGALYLRGGIEEGKKKEEREGGGRGGKKVAY